MKAPVGAVVRIFYDGRPPPVEAGHALVTTTGRVYLVLGVRQQRRGKHLGRFHLTCIIQREVPADAFVHRLIWYRR